MPSMLGDDAFRIDMTQLPPEAAALIERLQQQEQAQAREIAWRDAKLEKINFELVRLKRWKYGAKTESMTVE
jgi:transposase